MKIKNHSAIWFSSPLYVIFTLLVSFFLLPTVALSMHIIGGEMTYKFVSEVSPGVNRYEFVLIVYRDCDSGGGNLDNPAPIAIYQGNSNVATLYADFSTPWESVTTVPPVIPPCANTSSVSNACVQKGVYRFYRNLPVSATESYFIVYQRCCRTVQINNINNPSDKGATYQVEISPLSQQLKNSSAVFLNYPPTFICNNLPLEFDHSATDIDGDSLVYTFCAPLNGGGSGGGGGGCNTPQPNPPCAPPYQDITFLANYSAGEPLGGNPIISVDGITGKITGTPNMLGQYVVGICVQEYRNGQLIGTILRDFQFNVVDCTPTVAAIVEANQVTGPKQFMVKRCGEKQVTILNQSPKTADLLSWEWEVDMGNGNIFHTIAWHLTVALPDFGDYTVRLYLNRYENCKDTAFILLHAYPGVVANFDFDYDICQETPVDFNNLSVSGATGGIVGNTWNFGFPGGTSTDVNPRLQFPAYGGYPVRLEVTDSDGCKDDITKSVIWVPKLAPVIPAPLSQKICLPNPALFDWMDTLNVSGLQVLWDFGDGSTESNVSGATHVYAQAGVYTPSLFIKTVNDCIATDTFENLIRAFDSPKANFEYAPQIISNLDNTVYFSNLSDTTARFFEWQFGNEGNSSLENPVYAFRDTGLIPVKLIALNPDGCPDSLTRILDIIPNVRLYIPNVFAPGSTNGLGNDEFGVTGILPAWTDYHLYIWSRWGELLFHGEDPASNWDGRKPGTNRVMSPGVYVYQLTFTGPRGEPYRFEGTVTIL